MQKTAAALYQGCLDNSLLPLSAGRRRSPLSQLALSALHRSFVLSFDLLEEDGKEVAVAHDGGAVVRLDQPRLQHQPETGTTCHPCWTDGG